MSTGCSIELLQQLLEGNPAEPAMASLREHLAGCADCRQWLDAHSDDGSLRSWLPGVREMRATPPEAALGRMLHGLREDLARPSLARDPKAMGAALPFVVLEPPSVPGDLGRLGPYRVQEELGRGGMGIVFRAVDEGLGRTVALKVLRPDATSAAAQARLLREAQLAARLRHEHVVLVHAVEQPAGGLPYLVLEFVDGRPLGALLQERRRLPPAEAVELIAQAADGLAAAHAAGLAHRDVKPGNILIEAATGRVKLTDFGLARTEAVAQTLTPDGSVLGTPEYMSPEQAQGLPADARSDVYSLGVTLYETLTGEVPFRGTTHRVLQQVLRDEPPPARRLHDGVPRDLETICQKAMAKEPRRRYGTAAEFAADLRRWQRGEPILARPVGRLERGWRWCGRNPRTAGLIATLLLVFLVGFAGVAWQWRRAEIKADESRRHFMAAQEAVDRYLTAVSEDSELKARSLEPLRRKLLDMARDYYEAFIREHPEDPGLQAELGMAHGRLGVITAVLESPAQGLDHFERKRDIFERLCREQPQVAKYQHELADSYWRLGYGMHHAQKGSSAWEAFGQARRLWEELTERYPDEPEYAARLIRTLNSLGRSYSIYGHIQEAEQILRAGRSAYSRWVERHPAEARHQESVAWVLANLGSLYRSSGRLDAAADPLREAVALGESLTGAHPREPAYAELLRHALIELGWVQLRQEQAARAQANWQKALGVAEQLNRQHPDNAEYQEAVAGAWQCLGALYEHERRPTEAREAFERALAISERLIVEYPGCWPYAANFSGMAGNLTQLLRETGHSEAALHVSDHVIGRWESLFPPGRADEIHEFHRGSLHANRGLTLDRMGRYAAASADFDRASALSPPPYKEEFRRLKELMAAQIVLEKGDHARAAAVARGVAEQPGLPQATDNGELWTRAHRLYLASGLLARCAAAVRADQRLNAVEREQRVEQYAREAIALLRQAQAAGCFRLRSVRATLSADAEFESLRSRGDFQSFLAGKGPTRNGEPQ